MRQPEERSYRLDDYPNYYRCYLEESGLTRADVTNNINETFEVVLRETVAKVGQGPFHPPITGRVMAMYQEVNYRGKPMSVADYYDSFGWTMPDHISTPNGMLIKCFIEGYTSFDNQRFIYLHELQIEGGSQ